MSSISITDTYLKYVHKSKVLRSSASKCKTKHFESLHIGGGEPSKFSIPLREDKVTPNGAINYLGSSTHHFTCRLNLSAVRTQNGCSEWTPGGGGKQCDFQQ